MLSGGSLYLENNTEDLRCTIKKISELCDVREHLTISQCKEIGHSLCGTFVEFVAETKIFIFQHDSIESAVFFSFGNDYPEITLELCSLQALTKMCCLRDQGNLTGDESFLNFKIIIDNDTHVKVLVDRFLKSLDSRNKELFQCIAAALVWQSRRFSTYFLKSLTSEDDVINFLSKKDLDEQSLLPYFIYAENTLIVNGIVDKISQFNIREHHVISKQILLATISACLADRADICNYLIEFKDQVDDFVMFAAASTGNTSIMDKLLRHGGNINATISDKAKKDLENTIKNCVLYPNNESYHHGINLLHIACNYGRTDMVMYLKTKCLDLLHKTSNFEFTAAHFAARSDNVDLMKLLLTEELDLERRITSNSTVLHIAAANGNVEMVKYLMDMFPDMANQTSTNGWTVLHFSGRGGSVHVLNIFLEKGLDIMAKTDDDQNVLHISIEYNHLLMVKYLIETCPELIKEKDKIGQTALHYAVKVGSVSLIDTLLRVGSDITARRNDGSDVLQLAVLANNLSTTEYLIKTFPQLKHTINNNGWTVLHYCSQGGSIPAMELLLQEGIDLKAKTKQGNHALHIAAGNKNLPIVNYLIKECPKLVQQINNDGFTALHTAAQGGDIKVIKALIKAGSNITENYNVSNVLHTAVASNNLSAVKYLIDKYPLLVQLNNRFGWTPLHTACVHSGVPMVESLMQVEVDITAQTKQGETILHLATIHNNLSVEIYIVEHFPQIKHEIDFQMRTAIHCAAQEGNVPILEALLQAGLNITAMTNDGSNVLHIAAAHDKVSVAIYLVQTYSKVIRQLAQINNKSGWKPIHNAAKHGSVCLMEVLVQAGADITAKTEGGLSVVQIAKMENDLSMVIYLTETFPYLIP